jgi:uncharacterized protein YkwD
MRFISTFAIAALLALTLTSCGGGGGGVVLGPPSGNPTTMFAALNGLRTANGAGALVSNAQLAALAQAQADLNAASHSNVAVDATGTSIKQRLEAGGMTVVDLAVPVAYGNTAEAIDRWTNTQKEKDLLYSSNFTDMGIGMTMDGGFQRWVVVMAEVGP